VLLTSLLYSTKQITPNKKNTNKNAFLDSKTAPIIKVTYSNPDTARIANSFT